MGGYLKVEAVQGILQKTKKPVVDTQADVEFWNADLNKNDVLNSHQHFLFITWSRGMAKKGFPMAL